MSTIAVTPQAKRRRGSMQRTEAIWGICLALPWMFGFIIWTAGPMLASIVLSLTSWDLLSPPKFVGLQNYATLIGNDPSVLQSLKVTTIYAFFALPLNLLLGLFVA
ncbi:MAG TPA: ABC transporter permease, partial [Chloroflexota bacterium]|nr:ABC transporter permease [Chloroflexota bacterium]